MQRVYKLNKESGEIRETLVICGFFVGLIYENGLLELVNPISGKVVFNHVFEKIDTNRETEFHSFL
jgi:hypothetical protein